MAVNKAKQRMLEGKPAIGAEVGLGSPLSAELISPLGFDYVLVDNQHGAWADQSSMHAFRSISLGTAVPMARVRRNDFGLIGRLLDMGCMGIVVPMVNNAEEAEAAVFATRYPPLGGRSIGPFGTGFLGDDYDDWANDQIFLAVQIETDDGARNAEEIMAVDGIDGCWIGPGDLSRYMRLDLNTSEGREVHTYDDTFHHRRLPPYRQDTGDLHSIGRGRPAMDRRGLSIRRGGGGHGVGRGQGSRDAAGARAVRGVEGRRPQVAVAVGTRQTLDNVEGILAAAGATMDSSA